MKGTFRMTKDIRHLLKCQVFAEVCDLSPFLLFGDGRDETMGLYIYT